MTIDHEDPQGTSITLTALISRLAAELFDAAADLKAVQDALDCRAVESLSADGVVTLQKLDLVEQTTRALAQIASSLSNAAPSDVSVDADELLSTCRLSSLVDRLTAIARPQVAAFELF